MRERSNQEWLADLHQPDHNEALADLRAFLVRGLGYALADRGDVDGATVEDFAQEALLKILENLDSYRGESRFLTWAQKIALHTAYTEMRRRRWQAERISLDELAQSQNLDFIPGMLVDPSAGPDQQAIQRIFLETLRRLIATELTPKQRQALVGTQIYGMPLQEIARQMGMNRNALYKLLHDARQRLKKRLDAEGISPEDVFAAFGSSGS